MGTGNCRGTVFLGSDGPYKVLLMAQRWVSPLCATRHRSVPAWDATTLLPSTSLLLKRREVAELERALQSQREALAARQERALRRAEKARAQAAEQDAEVLRLHQELTGLLRHRERLAQRLQSLHCFGEYLQAVLARTGQFQDVPAMLAHFGALAGARALLAQQVEARQEQLSQEQARLQRYQEEVSSELLRTSAELAQLRAQLEAARQDVIQEESHWAHIQSTATQKTLLLGQIKLAVLNLFQLATTRLKVPADAALEDTEAQLDTVLLCMQDLAAICAELHPGQPGLCPPHLPAATSHGGAKVNPSEE
ncbi:cilia- and flagella-associated protein 73 isoform X3 [Phaenicophaeus curvirostris]|uniref:cilia- and flagella-associated protein 73 isoform X3 n=1 Tax=Phaenicophaeus curvirostris TaxID=33595 RepID=UPI0037F098FA